MLSGNEARKAIKGMELVTDLEIPEELILTWETTPMTEIYRDEEEYYIYHKDVDQLHKIGTRKDAINQLILELR